jgi:hypothetical protein
MTEKEKFDILIEKGYYYDDNLGQIVTPRGILLKKNKTGYIHLSTTNKMERIDVLTHRLIWYIKTGEIPNGVIDHINQIKDDNKFSNLRVTTQRKNTWNQNRKGYTMVKDKYRAFIHKDYKRINLGYFETEQEAKQAYLEAKKKYHVI